MNLKNFDDFPDETSWSSALKLISFGAIIAQMFAHFSGLQWLSLIFIFIGLGMSVARQFVCVVNSIGRHTRYGIMDLCAIVALLGSVSGTTISWTRPDQFPDWDGEPAVKWFVCILLTALVVLIALRGVYKGLRLGMWLQCAKPLTRASFLIFGAVAFVAQVVWKLGIVLAALALVGALKNRNSSTWHLFIVLTIATAATAVLSFIHNRYRIQAQRNFESRPEAVGVAGQLTNPTAVTSMRLAGRVWGWFIRRSIR